MSVKDHVIWKASAVQILRPVAFPVRLYWSTAATQPRINNDDNNMSAGHNEGVSIACRAFCIWMQYIFAVNSNLVFWKDLVLHIQIMFFYNDINTSGFLPQYTIHTTCKCAELYIFHIGLKSAVVWCEDGIACLSSSMYTLHVPRLHSLWTSILSSWYPCALKPHILDVFTS